MFDQLALEMIQNAPKELYIGAKQTLVKKVPPATGF